MAARTSTRRCASCTALESYVADAERDGKLLIVCGDLNVALEERDIHPKLRKPGLIGAHARRASAARPDHFARPGRRASLVRARQRRPVHVVGAVEKHEGAQHRLADRLRAGVEGARRSREVSGRAARDRQQRSRTGRRAVRVLSRCGDASQSRGSFPSDQFGSFSITAFNAIAFSRISGCAIATSIRFSARPLPPVRA